MPIPAEQQIFSFLTADIEQTETHCRGQKLTNE